MTRCCLFWFPLPGPCTTFCVSTIWTQYLLVHVTAHTENYFCNTLLVTYLGPRKTVDFWQYFTCLFWFSLPGPCTTFRVCQRYWHNIYLYMLLNTPSIILTTHYLPRIWAPKNCWFLTTCFLVFVCPVPELGGGLNWSVLIPKFNEYLSNH